MQPGMMCADHPGGDQVVGVQTTDLSRHGKHKIEKGVYVGVAHRVAGDRVELELVADLPGKDRRFVAEGADDLLHKGQIVAPKAAAKKVGIEQIAVEIWVYVLVEAIIPLDAEGDIAVEVTEGRQDVHA